MKNKLIVLQDGSKDCGAASLLSVIRYYGGDITLDRLLEMTKTTKEGTNFYNMSEAIRKFGLVAKCFKVDDIEKIRDIDIPFIVQINNKSYMHFVVVYKVNNNKVTIMDPAKGKVVIDIFDFSSIWTGYVMLFEKVGDVPSCSGNKILNKIIWNTLMKNKSTILFLVVLSIIFTLLSCQSYLYSEIVFDKVIGTGLNNLSVITIFFSILLIVKNITNFIRNHLIIFLNQKLDINIILSTYSKVILLPYTFYKNKATSEVLSRINDLSYLKNFISKIVVTIFLDSFTFSFAFIIIYSINSRVLFILLLIGFIYIIILCIFSRIVKNNTVINQENNVLINNMIIESVSGFETIKGLNIEDSTIFKFGKLYTKLLNNLYYSEKINNIVYLLKELVTDIGLLIVNFVTIRLIMKDMLTTGNYMTVTFLAGYLIYPLKNLLDMLDEYHYVKSSLRRGNGLLEYEEEKIYDSEKLEVNGNIAFKNLSYTFNNKFYVLKDINLFIRDKERVLILGESGGGKSTIMKILFKYYEVDRGMVYINNYDINDYSVTDIRKHITYISQNELLFTGSIRDNILLGREVNEVSFLNICKILHIDEIVKNNILGYDYQVEENGINLSGGQRQRIILARSLIKNSKIIMIDESFNQSDTKLEREILIDIFNYFYDKTFIIISHRKENMDLYDRIIKISKGTVKEVEEVNR